MEQILMPLLLAATAFLVVLAVLILLRLPGRSKSSAAETAVSFLHNQINEDSRRTVQQLDSLRKAVTDSLQAVTEHLARSLAETDKNVGARLDTTARVIGDVRHQLGQLEQSSRRITDLATDMHRLQDILRPPKLRGALGELFLSDMLAQILPADHYTMQYQFKGGETVDAAIILRSGIVPIDAKFPLDNFKRIHSADTDDERKAAKRAFMNDVKGHIDAVASKYIRMDENTFDFALMYIPAENVYYETIVKDAELADRVPLFSYSLQKRVIPVSPNSLYAYLQTICLGLKGMRVEERSREILESLSRLQKEFDSFAETFRLVGQHLDNSVKKYDEAQKRLGKLESKVEQMDGLAKGLGD